MAIRENYSPSQQNDNMGTAFDSVEQAWFWFAQAQKAKIDGARTTMGKGLILRPCEPLDILRVVDRLYRNRRLLIYHLHVLRHYGLRQMPPEPSRVTEFIAHKLWTEAMERMEEPLMSKGIVTYPDKGFMEAAE